TLGGLGVDRKDAQARVEHALDRRTAVGLDRDAQLWERRDLLAEQRPSRGIIGKPQRQHDVPTWIDDDQLVHTLRPVESAEMSQLGKDALDNVAWDSLAHGRCSC